MSTRPPASAEMLGRPEQLAELLPPGGGGHVLATSRWSAWGRHAAPLRLDVLASAESVEFLRARTGVTNPAGLDALAELLGDLPLALEEAAAYLEETQESVDGYLDLVRMRGRKLFGLSEPVPDRDGDHRRVATVWSVSLDRVRPQAPAAEGLLNLCAFLAPDIPRDLPAAQPQLLPPDLAQAVGDRLDYNRTLAAIGSYSLAAVSPATIGLHRLVQAVIQARLGEAGEREWAATAIRLIRESFPNDSRKASSWPQSQRLLSHLLVAADHAERLGIAEEATGWLLLHASTYLRQRGQYRYERPH